MTGYVIPDLEATHDALFGQPHRRKHSVEKCGAIARSRGEQRISSFSENIFIVFHFHDGAL